MLLIKTATDFTCQPNAKVAKRFLGKMLRGLKTWEQPVVINTDLAPAYGQAIRELKQNGLCPPDLIHRKVKYLNNIIEPEHGRLKRLIRPTLGFKYMKTAYD